MFVCMYACMYEVIGMNLSNLCIWMDVCEFMHMHMRGRQSEKKREIKMFCRDGLLKLKAELSGSITKGVAFVANQK